MALFCDNPLSEFCDKCLLDERKHVHQQPPPQQPAAAANKQQQQRQQLQPLKMKPLCRLVVGGMNDFPPLVSEAIANIVSKLEENFAYHFYIDTINLCDIAAAGKQKLDLSILSLDDSRRNSMTHRRRSVSVVPGADTSLIEAMCSSKKELVSTLTVIVQRYSGHAIYLMQVALKFSELQLMCAVISGASLLLSVFKHYGQHANDITTRRQLQTNIRQLGSLHESLVLQLVNSQTSVICNHMISCCDSQHWSAMKPFYENDDCCTSFTVLAWTNHLDGLKERLESTLPPELSSKVFTITFATTFMDMAARYIQIEPSQARSRQYICDLFAILKTVDAFTHCVYGQPLCSATSGTNHSNNNRELLLIVSMSYRLLIDFVIVGCRLQTVYKIFKRGLRVQENANRLSGCGPKGLVAFDILLGAGAVPHDIAIDSSHSARSNISQIISHLVSEPQRNSTLVVKALLSENGLCSSLILRHLIVMPSSSSAVSQRTAAAGCGRLLCQAPAHTSCSLHINNQPVFTSLLYIVASQINCANTLHTLLTPALAQVTEWSALDKLQLWNVNRSVWHQALIDLFRHHVQPIVDDLLSYATNAADDNEISEHQPMSANPSPSSVRHANTSNPVVMASLLDRLLDTIVDTAPFFRPSLYTVCELISDRLPLTVHPLADSVFLQLVFATVYDILNAQTRRQQPTKAADSHTQTSQQLLQVSTLPSASAVVESSHRDLLLSVAEALCNVDAEQEQRIRRTAVAKIDAAAALRRTTASDGSASSATNKKGFTSTDNQQQTNDWNPVSHTSSDDDEYSSVVYETMANELQCSGPGRDALFVLNEFVNVNERWLIDAALGLGPSSSSATTKSTFASCSKQTFDKQLASLDWSDLFMAVVPELDKEQIGGCLSKRWEFRDPDKLSADEKDAVAFMKGHFKLI